MRFTTSKIATVGAILALTAGAAVTGSVPTLAASPTSVNKAIASTTLSTGTGVKTIVPGAAWSDQNGNLDQLRAVGTIMNVGGTYYAWGEDMTNGLVYSGEACYSSTDLVSWQRNGNALSLQASGDLGPNRAVGRPSVLYNSTTHKYVMWLHIDTAHTYSQAMVGVADSDYPCGPYDYHGSSNPLGQQSRDINVFQDADGSAYLLSEDRANGLRIDKLSDDYESVVSSVAILSDHEAPAMVKVDGTYYLFASHLSSLAPNDNQYTTATSLSGPWTPWKNLAPTGVNTFDSQISSVVTVAGTSGTTYMFVGDRWSDNDLYDSSAIWLPLSISSGTARLNWVPSWSLDVAAGTWTPQARYDTLEAGGGDTPLTGSAAVTACTGCTGESVVSGLATGPVTFTYDDADPQLVYSSTGWTHGSGSSYATEYDSTKSFASAGGSTMTVDFTGSTIRLIGLKGPNYGTATIKIDGAQVGTFDGYSSTQLHKQVMYSTSGLSSGSHELVLTVNGTKDAQSTSTYISVDAVDLHASDTRTPAGGTITFNDVSVPVSGAYSLKISYVNPNAADQYATITPNGGASTTIALPPTGSSNATGTALATVTLSSGSNSIVVGAPSSSSDTEIDTIAIPQPQS